jgi:hypothetical protein
VLGRGYGGKWELTGELDEDRAAVVDALRGLIDLLERGDLDDILLAVPGSGDR